MPVLELEFKYRKNEGLVLSPAELKSLYFYGITIQDRSGKEFPLEVWRHFVVAAQQEIEKYLGIKLSKQIIEESFDFYVDDWRQWNYIPTTYPVVRPFKLTGFLGTVKQLEYPSGWLTNRKTSDGETYSRRIFTVPVQGGQITTEGVSMLYSGVLPSIGMNAWNSIPNYWTAVYCTGFDKVPVDLIDVIGKLAAVGVFNVAGDIVLGQAALANYSLSLDGLSQSVGTTLSAENSAYSPRIKLYNEEIKRSMERLKSYYRGIGIITM